MLYNGFKRLMPDQTPHSLTLTWISFIPASQKDSYKRPWYLLKGIPKSLNWKPISSSTPNIHSSTTRAVPGKNLTQAPFLMLRWGASMGQRHVNSSVHISWTEYRPSYQHQMLVPTETMVSRYSMLHPGKRTRSRINCAMSSPKWALVLKQKPMLLL